MSYRGILILYCQAWVLEVENPIGLEIVPLFFLSSGHDP